MITVWNGGTLLPEYSRRSQTGSLNHEVSTPKIEASKLKTIPAPKIPKKVVDKRSR